MQYDIEVGQRVRRVVVNPSGDGFAVAIDGRSFHVGVVRIDEYTLSLLVDKVCSHEVVVAPDATRSDGSQLTVLIAATPVVVHLNGRRHTRRADAMAAGSGPQRVVAPMPGKVVRVPVAPGETVSAGQALVVVEAMKMENELRAARDGVVADLQAREGMSVEAGTLLVVVQ
jgi:biotin carboxyl carrier protein